MMARKTLAGLFCALLTGCGTYVPELADPPSNQADGQLLVQAIVRSVNCEMRNAVAFVIDRDKELAAINGQRTAAWFEKWGVQAALTLTIDEKTSINPTAIWTPPNPATALFTLAGGVSASADATRIDTLNFYHTVKDLYRLGPCPAGDNAAAPMKSLLIQGDLKLRQWLVSHVLAAGTGEITAPTGIDTPLKQDALSHEVRFLVATSGNINPAWTFVHVNVNPAGPLLSTSRDRTHDLLLTFGPVDPSSKRLASVAAGTFQASQIGVYMRSAPITRFGF